MIGEFVVSVSGMAVTLRIARGFDDVRPNASRLEGANEKGRPEGRPFLNQKPAADHGREPSPSGEDLQLSGDPGHGSG